MISEDFRLQFSALLEHYQYIELHLEGIYACICGRSFFDSLEDVSNYSLTRLVRELEKVDEGRMVPAFGPADYKRLDELCERRNYWVHNAFVVLAFDPQTGELKYKKDRNALRRDTQEAEWMRDFLYEKKSMLMADNRKQISEELDQSVDSIQ